MVKSASVNLLRTIWICNIFSVIPLPIKKRKKEDFSRAGKTPGQTKLFFAKKIIFFRYVIVYTVAISFCIMSIKLF